MNQDQEPSTTAIVDKPITPEEEEMRDQSLREKTFENTAEERYGFLFDVDQWYDACSDFTQQTQFIPVSKEEAAVIVKQYEFLVLKKTEQELQGDEYECLKALENKIETVLEDKFYDEETGCPSAFIRLSARSPKDAAFSSEKIKQVLKRKLYERKAAEEGIVTPEDRQNDEFISFFEAQVEVMRFENAQEAIEMIATSNRVYEDLNIALKYKGQDEKWNIQVVVRKWIPHHDIALEFRGFVFKRQLCALSQYFDALYFPHLIQYKEQALSAIQKFFEQVKDRIPFESCVLDFVIVPEEDASTCLETGKLHVEVLEFNPFNRFTAAALFSWRKDLEVLTGNEPFQFRLRSAPLPALRQQAVDVEKEESSDVHAQIMFNLMDVCDENVFTEHQGLIDLVEDFMGNDLDRINSNLRYVLQKTVKEKMYTYVDGNIYRLD